ncbi:hypothetical protein CC1G_15477 [Coprinopsis cinerea okayama7|uniref:Uncharacterized protein n=1 Tax=Coprinopsis cinerea (strain Okayama-7 / 130 / ATCC MYA-4618 / FGSC 9003) TaxID=240176 RepID=D6RQW1_COPC7|nr:hypothetical protein CC1G_15477 [Coprinopsis cinerea okayama7\|eukprot:XP_002910200.1 hypothetical protein CC1G_15477 [Coprinopsis cinerea okayama7\
MDTTQIDRDIDALLSLRSRTSKARTSKLKGQKASGSRRTSQSSSSSRHLPATSKKTKPIIDDTKFTEVCEVDEVERAGDETPWSWRHLRQAHRDGINEAIRASKTAVQLEFTFKAFMSGVRDSLADMYPDGGFKEVLGEREDEVLKGLEDCRKHLEVIRVQLELAIRWGRLIKPLGNA